MAATKVIASSDVERLKQQARKLKRETSLSHTQALDAIAIENGFPFWHCVIDANALVRPAEMAINAGCVMAFDIKDAMDVDNSDGVLIEDHFIALVAGEKIFNAFANSIDEDDDERRPIRETLSPEELREAFELDCALVLFRLNEQFVKKSIQDIMSLIKERSFFQPEFIWFKGDLVTNDFVSIDAANDR